MASNGHQTYVYVGLGGESDKVGPGGLYRRAEPDGEWESITKGLRERPQIRSLLVHPQDPGVVFAGTQRGAFRTEDRGDHWEPLGGVQEDVWALALHPQDPDVIYAGYDPCAIHRSEDGGRSWRKMDTSAVVYPHITTYMAPLVKRVLSIASDPSNPQDMYAAIEVGGLLASRDSGDSWKSIIDGPYINNATLDLHDVLVSPSTPRTVFIVTQTAAFRSQDRGQRWEHLQIGEMFPGGSYCRALAANPGNLRTLYMAVGAGGGSAPQGTVEAGGLLRSRDAGDTWEAMVLGEPATSRMFKVAVDTASPDRLFCCTWGGQVYSSTDGGESWLVSQVPGKFTRPCHVYTMACG